jgi:hypothetical protein
MVYVFQLQHCSMSAIWVDCPASLFQAFSNLVGEYFPSQHLVESRCSTLVLHAFDYVPRWGFPSPHPSSKLPIFLLLILMHHPLCWGQLSPNSRQSTILHKVSAMRWFHSPCHRDLQLSLSSFWFLFNLCMCQYTSPSIGLLGTFDAYISL